MASTDNLLKAISDGDPTGLIRKKIREQIVVFSERVKKPILEEISTISGQKQKMVVGYEQDNLKPRVKYAPFSVENKLYSFTAQRIGDSAIIDILEKSSAQIGTSINNICSTCPNLELELYSNLQPHSDIIAIRTVASCRYKLNATCPDEVAISWTNDTASTPSGIDFSMRNGEFIPQPPRHFFSNESNWAKYSNDRDIYPAPIKPPNVELEDIKFELNVLLNDDFGLF